MTFQVLKHLFAGVWIKISDLPDYSIQYSHCFGLHLKISHFCGLSTLQEKVTDILK